MASASGWRLVSRSSIATASISSTAYTASTTKVARQPQAAVSQPPNSGASSGASAVAVETWESMRADSAGP